MKKILLPLLALTLVVASCKKKEKDPVEETPGKDLGNYIPTTVGSYWVYDYNDGTSTDIRVDEIEPGTKNILGTDHFIISENLYTAATSDTSYLYEDNGSFYKYDALLDVDVLIFDASKTVGETWQSTGIIDTPLGALDYEVDYECIQNGTSLNVSGTDYQDVFGVTYSMTIKNAPILGDIPATTVTSYYAYSVGLIKYSQSDASGFGLIPQYDLDITEYEIAQ